MRANLKDARKAGAGVERESDTMTDANGAYQPSAEELTEAIKNAKATYPDYGIKRIWTFLKEEKKWDVSEKRVKKVKS